MSAIAFTVGENEIIGLSDGLVYSNYKTEEVKSLNTKKVYKPSKNCVVLWVGNGINLQERFAHFLDGFTDDFIDHKELALTLDTNITNICHQLQNEGKLEEFVFGIFIVGYDQDGKVIMYEICKNLGESYKPDAQIYGLNVGATFCLCEDLHTNDTIFKKQLFEVNLPELKDLKAATLKSFKETVQKHKEEGKRIGGEIFIESVNR